MNNEQQELLDEAYRDYCDSFNGSVVEPHIKSTFIDMCKHSIEYSIRWGLKIEEREYKLITITYNDKTIESYEL